MKLEVFASRGYKPSLKSKLIMWWIEADFSHVGIILNDTRVFHAIGKGFSEETVEEFTKEREFVHRIDVTDRLCISEDRLIGFLEGRLDKEYSQSQYIGVMIPYTQRFFKDSKDKEFCSEAVPTILRYATCLTFTGSSGKPINLNFMGPKVFLDTFQLELATTPRKL